MRQGNILTTIALVTSFIFSSVMMHSQNNLAVYFTQEQPVNTTPETAFGEDIRGTYNKENEDFVDIVIDERTVEVRYLTRMFLPTTTIEQEDKYYFKSNKLFGVDSTRGLEYFIENDTVYFGVFQKETLFNLKTDVVKKLNNQYVINKPIAKGVWEVNLLYKKEHTLYLRTIDIIKDKPKLTEAFKTLKKEKVAGTSVYLLTPSQNQFKSFVAAKGFYDIIKYIKVL